MGRFHLLTVVVASLATGTSCRASLNEHYVLSANATLILARLYLKKLAEVHGLYLVKETVRKLMTQAGLWLPASHGRLVYISHDRVAPAPENSSRLMAVSIAGRVS
jgi:hypothetical protein